MNTIIIVGIVGIVIMLVLGLFACGTVAGSNKLKSDEEKMAELDEQEQYLAKVKRKDGSK